MALPKTVVYAGVGAVHMYQSMVQTIAGDYLLTIEIYAYSKEELQQMAASPETWQFRTKSPELPGAVQ